MAKGLQIAEPPRRRSELLEHPGERSRPASGEKFSHVAEGDKVQFNKRVTRGVAD